MALALRAIGQKQSAAEQQLVAAVRQGDDRAFEELFSRYRSRITAYVLGMVRDHARAEDITQEVFLSALRRLRASERPIAFKPWIYEIARNACIDEFRRTRRAPEVSLSADEESGGGERNLVSKGPTPDAAMENKLRLEALRGAFRGLSETHHRILVMRELEGLSYRDIADRMGMSRPMVESALFRARRRLGEEYQELSSGRRCQQVCEVIDRADASTIRVLGIRARRQVALHLSHCDDCRRYARVAGADESLFRAPTFADKVAALLPFGWLGSRFGGAASQLAGSLGSGAILGRVAAAVLMIAAAGGTYAGVSSSGGATTARNASAPVQRSATRTAAPRTAGAAGIRLEKPIAATAATLRGGRAGGGGQAAKPGAASAGKKPAARGSGSSRASASSPARGGSARSAGGTGASSSSTTSSGQRRVLGSNPVRNILGPVLAPVAPRLPSLRPKSGGNGLSLPSAPAAPALPSPPAPPALPNPKTVLQQPGSTAGNVAGSAGSTVNKITSGLP